ncbi:MAG: hypothetical protein IPJ14_10210 [Kineosporiaceae bacterium]|nr:hypothetical protein [Kineosporiaceae bacterium]
MRNTEVCRVAVIEARVGAELLLEGAIDPELHDRLVQLGRVPEAARVATLGPRPVPQAFSPHPAPPPPAPQQGYQPAPDVVDLRDSARPIDPAAARSRRDEFADLIPPPLLPPGAPQPPSGPAPSFMPHEPAPYDGGNGSNNGSNGGGRLPSAFRSPQEDAQPANLAHPPSAPPAPIAPPRAAPPGWPPVPAAPHLPPNDLFQPPPTRVGPSMGMPPSQPGAPGLQRITVTVDTGEVSAIERVLIVGRAPAASSTTPMRGC